MHGQNVILESAAIRFGNFTAVHPTNLHVNEGEFFSILGPSGCGKTTLLRAISGFTQLSEGSISIGGKSMGNVGPHERPTALIFQNLALFPRMKLWENVAFGLEMHKVSKQDAKKQALELLDMVALSEHVEKLPAEISGGQRQRVAIARALAVDPSVLLLDEPLSALDLKLRQHMRAELKEIQKKTGVTFIYITHDQGEALTMSDRVAVMRSGVIQQIGTADEIYSHPANSFVASFVGENNLLNGTIHSVQGQFAVIDTKFGQFKAQNCHDLSMGAEAMLFVRPEKMQCIQTPSSKTNILNVTFIRRDLEGAFVNLFFDRGGEQFMATVPNDGQSNMQMPDACTLTFAPENGRIIAKGDLADD